MLSYSARLRPPILRRDLPLFALIDLEVETK